MALLAFKVYIMPVLAFTTQFDDLPVDWPQREQAALRQLLPGPFNWLAVPLAKQLKALGGPTELASLEATIPAMRLRIMNDLNGKGCSITRLNRLLLRSRRQTEYPDRDVRLAQWFDGALTSRLCHSADTLASKGITISTVRRSTSKPIPQKRSPRKH